MNNKLNKNDNIGIGYSYSEKEDNMLKLYKKYPEEHLEMLYPLFILYYKQGCNIKGDSSEINYENYNFLTDTVPNIKYFILENSKKY